MACPFPDKIFPEFSNSLHLVAVDQVRLGQDNCDGSSKILQPKKRFLIDGQNPSSDIDQQENPAEIWHLFHQKSREGPSFLSCFLISFHVPVPWKVDKVSPLVKRIQIRQRRLSRCSADFGEMMSVGQPVDQGRFPDIRPTDESDHSVFPQQRKVFRRGQGADKRGC